MPTVRRPPLPMPRTAQSKIAQNTLGDRGVASANAPSDGPGNSRTQISTYFTKAPQIGEPTPVLYPGDRLWARVTLTLETAGPVAVGTMSQISPVLSGRGELLETDVPMYFDIAKGTKLYIAATGVNRVKFKVEAFPWLEQITGLIRALFGRLTGS